MEPFLVNGIGKMFKPLEKPAELLATLCHEDFVRNNILFRKIDHKMHSKLIDFGTIVYDSPVKDLSTFLKLDCSSKIRTLKLTEIFDFYHEILIASLKESIISD